MELVQTKDYTNNEIKNCERTICVFCSENRDHFNEEGKINKIIGHYFLPENQFAVRINIDKNGKVVDEIEYGKKKDSVYYNYKEIYHIANRESARYSFFGRNYVSQDVSTIVRAHEEGKQNGKNYLKTMRFPPADCNSNLLKEIINEAKDKYQSDIENNNQEGQPRVLLVSYRIGRHATVLAIDLENYNNSTISIMCFDSSHTFCFPMFIGQYLDMGKFNGLNGIISPNPMNTEVIQKFYDFNCTHYAEAFILVIGKYITNNPTINLDTLKADLNNNNISLMQNIITCKNISVESAGKVFFCCYRPLREEDIEAASLAVGGAGNISTSVINIPPKIDNSNYINQAIACNIKNFFKNLDTKDHKYGIQETSIMKCIGESILYLLNQSFERKECSIASVDMENIEDEETRRSLQILRYLENLSNDNKYAVFCGIYNGFKNNKKLTQNFISYVNKTPEFGEEFLKIKDNFKNNRITELFIKSITNETTKQYIKTPQ